MMPEKFHRSIANILDRDDFLLNFGERCRGRKTNVQIAYTQLMLDSATAQCYCLRFLAHLDDDS